MLTCGEQHQYESTPEPPCSVAACTETVETVDSGRSGEPVTLESVSVAPEDASVISSNE